MEGGSQKEYHPFNLWWVAGRRTCQGTDSQWHRAIQLTSDAYVTLLCCHTCVTPICRAVILLLGWNQVPGLVFDRPSSCACCRWLWNHGMWGSCCRSATGAVFPEVSEKSHWNMQPLVATSISSLYCPLSRTFFHWTQALRITRGSSIFVF